MNKLLPALLEKTARINQTLESLAEIGQNKQHLIIFGKVQELDKLIQKEGIIVSNLEKLEGARFKLQSEIASAWEIDVKELTASRLVQRLQAENNEYYNVCKEQIEQLSYNLMKLKNINKGNNELINQSLDYIDMMQSLLGEDVAGTYSDQGIQDENKYSRPRLNLLDKKA